MKTIEILAPAGSYVGMKAAMNAGCDAVYIGGSRFGARAYADNPGEDDLLRAIDEAHLRDKKLYLTVNTLVKEKELTQGLYSFLDQYYLRGLDAVIVQDVGVMHFIHRNFPELPIHASTQMTLTMAQGANLLKDYGVTRLVTARELSFSEIKNISQNTDMEIETFVHGALCYSYSGQCLMSSMIGGRSGNRGRCAQPCRMPYQLYFKGNKISRDTHRYLLSPKDINTLEFIPDLIDAGVSSFKIEGRMKRPEYAAFVSALYRKYTDYYLEHGKEKYQEILSGDEFYQDMLGMQDIYNRGGFCTGYGDTYHGKSMMSMSRPNHSGVPIGEVSQVKGNGVSIYLKEEIHAQDILEIWCEDDEKYEFTVKDSHEVGAILNTNIGIRRGESGEKRKCLPIIQKGNPVYRTKNNKLLEDIAVWYLKEDKKLPIKGELKAKRGENLKLTVRFKEYQVSVELDIVQEAVKQPMSKEKLASPIYKTGDTLYYFEELIIEMEDNLFVPVAWLNEIRRNAIEKLEEEILCHYRRDGKVRSAKETENILLVAPAGQGYSITVSVQNADQLEMALELSGINRIYAEYGDMEIDALARMAEKAHQSNKLFYLSLPYICRHSTYVRLEKELDGIINNNQIQGFLIKNFEEVTLLSSLLQNRKAKKEMILNHNMYVFNKEARSFWIENGITNFTAPIELNYQELKQLDILGHDIVVYGHIPLMISAQCLYENATGCIKGKQSKFGYLTDRLGIKFPVKTDCSGCHNVIYNGQVLALHKYSDEIISLNPDNIRLDFTMETPDQMKKIVECFVDTFRNGTTGKDCIVDYTTGHFKRGVL